jgi:hypothetical protein
MSYWNATTREIVSFDDYPWPGHPGWMTVDCGCCVGIRWGGEFPVECDDCGGTGRYARHERSGALALWPGGPFVGREPQERQT